MKMEVLLIRRLSFVFSFSVFVVMTFSSLYDFNPFNMYPEIAQP